MFVAFEGGEGSGKSTQIARLAAVLRARGHEVLLTHEPGATEAGATIRDLVLHSSTRLSARAEALLFAADRAHHVETVIRPALEQGRVVLTDRYVDSSLAYQGVGRRLPTDEVARLSQWATQGLVPDLTVLLDIPAADGLRRARGEGAGDKVESESISFHERVREAFRSLAGAEPSRYAVIDATRPVDEVATAVASAVAALPALPTAGREPAPDPRRSEVSP